MRCRNVWAARSWFNSERNITKKSNGVDGQYRDSNILRQVRPYFYKKERKKIWIFILFNFFLRRHTLALVPSRGRVYAFGLGGAGQLGTRVNTTCLTPQVVLGPWVSPSGVSVITDSKNKPSEHVLVTHIYSGGDQSFVSVVPYKVNF